MEIRRLEVWEHEKTRPLYEEVFSEDSKGFVDYYYTEKTKDNQIYVVEEDGTICAMLHLNPYPVMVNGQEKLLHYIVAVATKPEYRKRGYMAALIRRVLEDMYAAGEIFTYLMPAAEGIYLPHDFRTVYRQERRYYEDVDGCTARPEDRESKGTQPGETERALSDDCTARPAEAADCESLAEAAEAYLSEKYQVYAKRDKAYYERLLKEYASEGGKLMLTIEEGQITDCRIYEPDRDADSGMDRNPGSGADREENSAKEFAPLIMVRVVDARRLLMSVGLSGLCVACFRITDPLIPENNRCVVITGTEYSGVMLMDGKEENSEGTIPVSSLAAFLFGALTVEELRGEEGVEMSERLMGELGKIIPLKKIYLNEVV